MLRIFDREDRPVPGIELLRVAARHARIAATEKAMRHTSACCVLENMFGGRDFFRPRGGAWLPGGSGMEKVRGMAVGAGC